MFGFGQVSVIHNFFFFYFPFFFLLLIKLLTLHLVEEDQEFECVGVLHEHSQDVKKVKWHPIDSVSDL